MFWIYRLLHLWRYIAKYVDKSMFNQRWITSPAICCCPFTSKAVFEQFWKILSSPFTVPNSRRTREESLFWKGSRPGAIFSLKIASPRFQTLQEKGRKIHASPLTFRSKILWLSSDASLRRTVRGGPNGVHLRESYVYCLLWVVHKRFKFIVRLVIIS